MPSITKAGEPLLAAAESVAAMRAAPDASMATPPAMKPMPTPATATTATYSLPVP